jgi:DUF1680 family protein
VKLIYHYYLQRCEILQHLIKIFYLKHLEILQYWQAHERPVDQKTAEGHSVRALYMFTAMADLARLNNDE